MSSSAILRRIDPRAYFEKFLAKDVYPDGRSINEYRNIGVMPGTDWKHHKCVRIEYGSIVLAVSGQLAVERTCDAPSIIFHVENEDSARLPAPQKITEILELLTSQNAFFDRSELKTNDDAFEWQLRVTITIFSADGFVLDAVLIGLNALLLQIRIPAASYNWVTCLDKDEQRTEPSRLQIDSSVSRRLQIKNTPVFTAFGLYRYQVNDDYALNAGSAKDIPMHILVDPPSELVPHCVGTVQFVHVNESTIAAIDVEGSVSVDGDVFDRLAGQARDHFQRVSTAYKTFAEKF